MRLKNKIQLWIIKNLFHWECWKEIEYDDNQEIYGYNWWYERKNNGHKLICFEYANEE